MSLKETATEVSYRFLFKGFEAPVKYQTGKTPMRKTGKKRFGKPVKNRSVLVAQLWPRGCPAPNLRFVKGKR